MRSRSSGSDVWHGLCVRDRSADELKCGWPDGGEPLQVGCHVSAPLNVQVRHKPLSENEPLSRCLVEQVPRLRLLDTIEWVDMRDMAAWPQTGSERARSIKHFECAAAVVSSPNA